MTIAQLNAYNEQRMATVLELLTEATQAATLREGDALVARAANVLAGVVRRQTTAKVVSLPVAPRPAR